MAQNHFDVIIIGGSYAGLSAAMSLGRSLRNVLVIDNEKPCNRFTPHSHNFITHDGTIPADINKLAKEQVEKYDRVKFYNGLAVKAKEIPNGFEVSTSDNNSFTSRKLIIASGIKDIMPDIKGFTECWGISVIHCPYCHGYEYREQKTGVLANGEKGYHYAKLISNLTKDLVLFTNGKADFTPEQLSKLKAHNIPIMEAQLKEIIHTDGKISCVILTDGSEIAVNALYNMPAFEFHSEIPSQLNLEIENGKIKTDALQKTNVKGVFACGDISNMRAVSVAIASGTTAGAAVNLELIEESF